MNATSSFVAFAAPATDHGRVLADAAKAFDGQKGGIKAIAEGKKDQFRVNPFALHVKDGLNARDFSQPENIAHVADLSASIAVHGVKKAIEVYLEDGRLVISDGESRLRATLLAIQNGAEIKTVPVVMGERFDNEASRIVNQIVCNSGKRFNALEQGKVFARLAAFGWTIPEIAHKTSIEPAVVTRWLELQAAPEAVLGLVRQGKVAPTEAWRVLKASDSDAEAVDTLTNAVADAVQSGRAKATAKNVRKATNTVTSAQKLKEIREAFATATEVKEGDEVIIAMDAATFDKIREYLFAK
jgi:ParB family transcriptional regulator, chromosome partitioning protein